MLIWPGESWWPAAVLPVSGGGGETAHVAHHVPGSSQEQAGVSERLPSCLLYIRRMNLGLFQHSIGVN